MDTIRARRFPAYADDLESADLLFETDRRSPAYARWVQSSLNRVMGAGLAVDGKIGPRTRAAVQAFQRSRGLVADGIVGPRTEAALVAAGASSPPGATAPGPGPAPTPAGPHACPEPARMAVDRCLNPGSLQCPAIPNLQCMQSVDGVPFEYPTAIGIDPVTRLRAVTNRQRTRTQRFVPSVRDSLTAFITNMRRFGIPIEAILTQGSLYCRCISNTNTLSNHSFGDAIDVAGVRWAASGSPPGRLRETIVHNCGDPGERAILRRINACLRLSFATVIDYNYNSAHQDHFHCDNNRGAGRPSTGKTTMVFTQEALSHVLGRNVPMTGKLDTATKQALSQFSGRSVQDLGNRQMLDAALNELFARVASGQ